MSIKIKTTKHQYEFNGPYILSYNSSQFLFDRSGIYIILCLKKDLKYDIIDVGESSQVKTRIERHDRKICWEKKCNGILYVAVRYTPNLHQEGRKKIEDDIRKYYNPPCGSY